MGSSTPGYSTSSRKDASSSAPKYASSNLYREVNCLELGILLQEGPYTSEHLKFKAIQNLSRLFEKEIHDCFNDICTFKCSKLS